MIRWVVLGLLRRGESLHGYALVKAFRELTGAQLNSGNFYRELKRLAGEGLVARAARSAKDEDPRRMLYAITHAGSDVFDSWFSRPPTGLLPAGEDDLSLRSLFVGTVEREHGRRLLARWRDELWFQSQVLERERDAEIERDRKPATGSSFPSRAGLLGRRLRHVAADIEYLDEVGRVLEGSKTRAEKPAEAPARRNVVRGNQR